MLNYYIDPNTKDLICHDDKLDRVYVCKKVMAQGTWTPPPKRETFPPPGNQEEKDDDQERHFDPGWFGKRTVITEEQRHRVMQMKAGNHNGPEIAKATGLKLSTIYGLLRKL